MSVNKANPRSGSWVPVFSNTTNLDSDPTILAATFGLIGNLVTFQLLLTVDPTAAAATDYEFTLPVVPRNNFTGTAALSGVGVTATATGVATSVNSSTRGIVNWTSGSGTAETQAVNGSYLLDN